MTPKEAWSKLTDKQKKELEEDIREWQKWDMEERERVCKELKESGKWVGGLDGNYEEYKKVVEESKKRMSKIQEKYGV